MQEKPATESAAPALVSLPVWNRCVIIDGRPIRGLIYPIPFFDDVNLMTDRCWGWCWSARDLNGGIPEMVETPRSARDGTGVDVSEKSLVLQQPARVRVILAVVVGILSGCGDGGSSSPDVSEPEADGVSPSRSATVSEAVAKTASVTWETEDFNLAAGGQLHLLVDDFERDGRLGRKVLAQLASANFRGDCLLPDSMSTVYETGGLSIRRRAVEAPGGLSGTKRGVEGLAESFAGLLPGWADWSDIHLHFKITSVDLEPDGATTRVLFEAGARRGDRFIQLRGWWSCVWEWTGKAAPRLLGMRIESHEEVVGTSRGGRLLMDSTAAVLKPAGEVVEQLSRSVDHWRGRLQAELGMALHGHQGLAIGDVNGDGLEDIYLAQSGGLPNRLLIQQLDGTVIDVAGSAGVDWLDRSRSALLVDFDNDGDQDLACVLNVNLVLMENDGSGHFVERDAVFSTGDPHSLAAADFDGDGDLDLYVTGYGAGFLANRLGEGAAAEAIPYPYHDANNGGSNLLLRNDGDWQFVDVTDAVGLGENNRRWSFAASWSDYDLDGDLDLYVANDYGRNCLYRNDSGRFSDAASTAGVEDIAAGMSVSWCDYNGDGLPDIYVGNMFSSAGERIAYQRRFQPSADAEVRRQFQRHARGNTLFENTGNGTFRDVSIDRDVTMGRWSWGSPFVDINNDGRPDLLVANGYITGEDTKDL